MLLGLINIWSDTAFNALTSLSLIGQYISYLLPISLLAIRRVSTQHVSYGPFCLGRWGIFLNVVSICYTIILLIFMVLPPYLPATVENMNYAGPVFGLSLLVCWTVWLAYGQRYYEGPMREVIEDPHLK